MRACRIRVPSLLLATALIAGCGAESGLTPSCLRAAQAERSTYACLSDREMLAALTRVDGSVFIGFKEAGATRGVDETGRNVTSEHTAQAMIQLLLEKGMTIRWQATRQPAVAGRVPLRLELISELRRHPNVDYFDPDSPGVFHSPD